MIELLIVLYKPELPQLKAVLEAAWSAQQEGVPVCARLWHNDVVPNASSPTVRMGEDFAQRGLTVAVGGGEGNLGFGEGINRMLAQSSAEYVLVLNQDAVPEPGALLHLWRTASTDPANVAAWEMRQIPFEHPKAYDPVTLDTEWVSGAAVLLRASAVKALKGFEPRIFMYGEDVDLSWRLRVAGFRLRYLARSAVVHPTYSKADEVKPLQVLGGIYANLCLRARYSGHRRILQGISMACAELMVPESFPGRRRGILGALAKFARNYRYFWTSHQAAPHFEPRFAGWGYEERREGAFLAFKPQAEQTHGQPLVSILIRTHKRPGFLRQALLSVLHQTYPNIEAIVVEDGSDDGGAIVDEFKDRMNVRYFRHFPGQGRSVGGNRALAEARGTWLCFLDDDDLLFADHVEVLLQYALEHQVKGAYGLAWRTITRVKDDQAGLYEELHRDVFPDEAFNRIVMWHHNYIPIQAALFHRSLYDRHGGFLPDMDQLEDWNLWTRYTIDEDFVQVRKVTSKYRVPADNHVTAQRQAKLDAAYHDAVARQAQMTFPASPALVRKLAEDYARANALIHIGRDQVRGRMRAWPWFGKLMALRAVLGRRWTAR